MQASPSLVFVVLSGGAVRAGAFRGARKLAVVLSGGTVRAVTFRYKLVVVLSSDAVRAGVLSNLLVVLAPGAGRAGGFGDAPELDVVLALLALRAVMLSQARHCTGPCRTSCRHFVLFIIVLALGRIPCSQLVRATELVVVLALGAGQASDLSLFYVVLAFGAVRAGVFRRAPKLVVVLALGAFLAVIFRGATLSWSLYLPSAQSEQAICPSSTLYLPLAQSVAGVFRRAPRLVVVLSRGAVRAGILSSKLVVVLALGAVHAVVFRRAPRLVLVLALGAVRARSRRLRIGSRRTRCGSVRTVCGARGRVRICVTWSAAGLRCAPALGAVLPAQSLQAALPSDRCTFRRRSLRKRFLQHFPPRRCIFLDTRRAGGLRCVPILVLYFPSAQSVQAAFGVFLGVVLSGAAVRAGVCCASFSSLYFPRHTLYRRFR